MAVMIIGLVIFLGAHSVRIVADDWRHEQLRRLGEGLSKIINHPGHSTVTDNLDKLCNYFGCAIEQLVTHIKDETED